MINFFNLLLGMIDLPQVCGVVSTNSKYGKEMLKKDALYGVTKGKLNDKTWKTLVRILQSDTFRNLLDNFLANFIFPNELREQMVDLYGVDENIARNFCVDFSNIRLHYCHELVNTNCEDEHLVLVRIKMTKLSCIILDPCITMLISTYYQALLHYITIAEKYSNISTNYFHNAESCSPWIEEMFCLTFREVLGNSDNIYSCRISEVPLIDRLSPTPAYVLNAEKETTKGENNNIPVLLDPSFVCKDINRFNTEDGAKKHLYAWRNRISSYMENNPDASHISNLIYIDSQYGYSYDHELCVNNTILYGATESVPSPLKWLLNKYSHDWLRVPFIKVPRFKVKSTDELYDIIKALSGFDFLFRGQSSEHYLNRSSELMEKLYDDKKAIEPSLASYAVRENIMFEKYYVEWATIIKAYIYSALGKDNANKFLSKFDDFNYYLLCFSVAQHYGLPTYGLDVSASFSTALFFSFHQFTEIDLKTRKYTYKKKEKGTSIIYVFSPTKGEFFNFNRFDLHYNLFPRPLMQQASFAHCSWGYAKNAIAERLIAAIQFDVELIDFKTINRRLRRDYHPELFEENFFPSDDCFIDFLRQYITDTSISYNNEFKGYLKKYIYQI